MKSTTKTALYCILLIAACYIFGSSLVGNKHQGHYIWSDAEGYYMYLPAVFVTGTFHKMPVLSKNQFPFYPGTEKIFTKYSYGVAFFEMPFFLLAYLSRVIQGYNPGHFFAGDYSVGMLLGACVYGVLGLLFMYKSLLREYKSKNADLLTCASFLLGTNLLHYITAAPGMSHIYSFFLISLIVYLTPRFYERATWGIFLGMGFLFGFVILIRPTNILVVLYPLLYGIKKWQDIRGRWQFYQSHFLKLLVALLPVFLVWLPQMYYWKYITGDWILYSYGEEGFNRWKNPVILQVLFSPLNGWLIYSPILALSMIGMPFLIKGNRQNGLSVFLIFMVSLYLFASWWMWYFGGSLGYRSFVDLYPLLAIPFCFLMKKILEMGAWAKGALFVLLALAFIYSIRLHTIYSWKWSERDFDWEKYREVIREGFPFLGL